MGRDLIGENTVGELLDSMRLVLAVSLLGLPAVTLPVTVADGLPQSVQLIGAMYL